MKPGHIYYNPIIKKIVEVKSIESFLGVKCYRIYTQQKYLKFSGKKYCIPTGPMLPVTKEFFNDFYIVGKV